MTDHDTDRMDRVAKAIGDVCLWWGHITFLLHEIVIQLTNRLEDGILDGRGRDALVIIVLHLDERQSISVAKSLASELRAHDPQFYDKTEKLLNYIDNDVRLERNRFVHDEWQCDGSLIVRLKNAPKVVRPQSRQRMLTTWIERRYDNVEEVEAFVSHLKLVHADLELLEGHVEWRFQIEGQPEGYFPPLPPEWKSLAHRDWRGVDIPGLPLGPWRE